MERYYDNKNKISKQQKFYSEKNRDKVLLQKQNNRSIQIRDIVISYVELENILKPMGGNLKNISTNDSENN